MSNRLWFKAKRNRWGWTPITWEGWLVTFAGIVFIASVGVYVALNTRSPYDTMMGIIFASMITFCALTPICYWKGEKPRLSWWERKRLWMDKWIGE